MTTPTQGEHAQTEALRPKFGDLLRNTMASEGNPRRDAYFIREVHRSGGGVNPGRWFEMTDGKGETWLSNPQNMVQATPAQPAAPQGVAYAELPKITAEDRLFLHDNPNTDDIVKWVRDYARACIDADRASNGQAPAGAAVGIVRWAAGIEGSQLEVRWKDGEAPPAGTQVYAQTTTAQAAPAAGAVAGPVETIKFSDGSTADPVEKARRYLNAMADHRINSQYFFDDGWPKKESAIDAMATLAVLEQFAAAPTPAAQADSVLEDAAPQAAIENPYRAMTGRHEAFEQGVLKTLAAFRAKRAARKQGGAHD